MSALSLLLALLLLVGCGESSAPAPAPSPAAAERPFVLLLTVDTLRADRLGAYGSERELTPHLDALAEQSLVFDAAYAPTPFTLPSLATLLTGRYPEEIGLWSNESAVHERYPTLATLLHARGWSTAAVVSNWIARASAGLAAGFERYDDRFPQLEATRSLPERIAAATTDAALEAFDGLAPDAPGRLLWVHYQDPHGPYTPPKGYRERFLERERGAPEGTLALPAGQGIYGQGVIPDYQLIGDEREVAFYRAGYDGEVAYLDGEIGRLLDGLHQRVPAGPHVLVFAADHGESLGEHDHWFAHGERLSSVLMNVPLMIRAPGHEPGRRADIASLVDVLPTLLGVLTVPPGDDAALSGRDLLAPGAESVSATAYMATLASAERTHLGWVEDEFEFSLSSRKDAHVWDALLVRRGHDEVDITAAAPHIVRRLRQRLMEFRRRFDDAPPDNRQEFSEADRENLRALGYVRDAEP